MSDNIIKPEDLKTNQTIINQESVRLNKANNKTINLFDTSSWTEEEKKKAREKNDLYIKCAKIAVNKGLKIKRYKPDEDVIEGSSNDL